MEETGYTDSVYVLMQFGDQYVQDFKNSIISRLTILKTCKGRCLGVSEQIDVVEGTWKEQRAIAVFEFHSIFDAIMWLESDPEVRQGDFMNGTEIIMVPTLVCSPENKHVFQLMDCTFHSKNCYDTFMNQYVAGHLPELKKCGATNIVACPDHSCHRGNWRPNFIVAHQWPSHEAFYEWYRSDEYIEKWKQYRLESTCTNMIIFKLDPLCVG